MPPAGLDEIPWLRSGFRTRVAAAIEIPSGNMKVKEASFMTMVWAARAFEPSHPANREERKRPRFPAPSVIRSANRFSKHREFRNTRKCSGSKEPRLRGATSSPKPGRGVRWEECAGQASRRTAPHHPHGGETPLSKHQNPVQQAIDEVGHQDDVKSRRSSAPGPVKIAGGRW